MYRSTKDPEKPVILSKKHNVRVFIIPNFKVYYYRAILTNQHGTSTKKKRHADQWNE
jgi:hypothetical protein